MAKAEFPHDMELSRLKKRRRFLRRSIRKARARKAALVAARRPRSRIVQVNEFIAKRKKQLGPVEYEIKRRRKTLREQLRIGKSGFTYVNGRLVCGWIAEELAKARGYGWRGSVVSGYRTPAYSESLCFHMCGRPSCPGRCAGRNTNHARGPAYPLGAVDVTDYWHLQQICRQHGLRIHNGLPSSDPVHFSHAGN